MTSLLALEGVGRGTQGTVDVPRPAQAAPNPSESFDAALARLKPKAEGLGEKFEASTLTQFVQQMLPADDSEIWGGSAGAMFRGIYAEKLADSIAKAGGIGIAAMIDKTLAAPETPK